MNPLQPDQQRGEQADSGAPWAPFSSPVRSVPGLLAAPTSPAVRAARRSAIASIAGQPARVLVLRIATTDDPLVLWALHLRLDRLNVPPCQRWPANCGSDQAEFITALADLLWLHRRMPDGHRPTYRGWRDLLVQTPACSDWHEHALRQYLYAARRGAAGRYSAEGLGLNEAQRAETMMMPTARMNSARECLRPTATADAERALLGHAMEHPDRAGKHQPHDIATRHLLLWRCWLLAGESPGRAAAQWATLTGETLTRQRVAAIAQRADNIIRPRRRPAARRARRCST